jgi:hypothetical protein
VLANIFLSSCCSCEGWSGSERECLPDLSALLYRRARLDLFFSFCFFLLEIIKLIDSFSIYLVPILSFGFFFFFVFFSSFEVSRAEYCRLRLG